MLRDERRMRFRWLAEEEAGHRLRAVILLRSFPASGPGEVVGQRFSGADHRARIRAPQRLPRPRQRCVTAEARGR